MDGESSKEEGHRPWPDPCSDDRGERDASTAAMGRKGKGRNRGGERMGRRGRDASGKGEGDM
jgi:hypothetical protein